MSDQAGHLRTMSRLGALAAALVAMHLVWWLAQRPEPGAWYIRTRPPGAQVFVQRIDLAGLHLVPIGTTPGPLRLNPKEGLDDRYVFKLAGYHDLEKEIPRDFFGPSSPTYPARGALALKPRIPVLTPAFYWARHNPLLLLACLSLVWAGRLGYRGWQRERGRAIELAQVAAGQVEIGSSLDGYVVERGLGVGGMARVYLVRKPGDPVPAALKLLSRRFSQNPEFVDRFRREINIYRELSHPNIVELYDWGTVANQHYLVSEYVEGTPMSALLGQPLEPRQVLEWAIQLADALAYAHGRGIVHRDIKPSNVMVHGSKVKLMDFGIALLVDEERLTQAGDALGTVGYMAPEQLGSAPVDWRCDYYSLGVMLFECLGGRLPYEGNTLEMLTAQATQSPADLAILRPDLPPDLVALVGRLMSLDPTQRAERPEQPRLLFEQLLEKL